MPSQLQWSVKSAIFQPSDGHHGHDWIRPDASKPSNVPHSWSPVFVFFFLFCCLFFLIFLGALWSNMYYLINTCMIADCRVWDAVFILVVLVVVVVGPPTPTLSILKLFPNFWWTLTGAEPLGQSLGFIDDQRLTADLDSKFSHAQMQLFLGTRAPGAEVKGRSLSTLDMQMISF